MKMKKILTVVMSVALLCALCVFLIACDKDPKPATADELELPGYSDHYSDKIPADFKLGVICLHGEESTYDKNFIDAAKQAIRNLGLSEKENLILKTNIAESEACGEAAEDLADSGCKIVFANSFGHETHLLKVAKKEKYKDVQFCHATGTMAHTENLPNFHNAFASIYEGRYLAGVAAGMKLNEMIKAGKFAAKDAKMGYVGAFTYAEVISGYTSFYLGAKSVCPDVTMDVKFTGSWYDVQAEKEAANSLINGGCKLISQHADSMGAPSACEEQGVPNVAYNGSTNAASPNTFIISSRIDWTPYFQYIVSQFSEGKEIADDWCGDIKENSVALTDLGAKATAEGTVQAIIKARHQLANGKIHVFDTDNFTVTVVNVKDGKNNKNVNATVDENGKLIGYMADVNTDPKFEADTEAVGDGYFHESEHRSAPYFDIQIDGIELLNAMY